MPNSLGPLECSVSGFPVLHHLPELAQAHVDWVSDAIQTSHPLLSPSLLAFNPFQHQGLSNESVLRIRWPKYQSFSFSFSISPSNVYSGLISFRIDLCVCLVTQLCPTLCDRMDCSLPGFSVHGDSPGKNTGVGCQAILEGIFPNQRSNPGLLHCRRILYQLSHKGSPNSDCMILNKLLNLLATFFTCNGDLITLSFQSDELHFYL